jgi:uncharacterized protein YjbI with pentapeptide repeats
MVLREELVQLGDNTKKDASRYYNVIKRHPLTFIIYIIIVTIALLSLTIIPHWQVSQFGINNTVDKVNYENQYRATFAQILGGIAIGIGLYYTWRRVTIAENELKISQEGQITERFTRAIDQLGAINQLGNPAIEIRLGGIYALEGIANESEKYYLQIIEILTAYVRMNSYIREEDYKNLDFEELSNRAYLDSDIRLKDSPEIQAIVTVISRRKNFLGAGEFSGLEFQKTYLRAANFTGTTTNKIYTFKRSDREVHLEGAFFYQADLIGADFERAQLKGANFYNAYLTRAYFINANLQGAKIEWAHLERASFEGANLEEASFDWSQLHGAIFVKAYLKGTRFYAADLIYAMFNEANLENATFGGANLENATFEGAELKGADFREAHLKGAKLSFAQLSKVKTLYEAEIDEEIFIKLKEEYPALFLR